MAPMSNQPPLLKALPQNCFDRNGILVEGLARACVMSLLLGPARGRPAARIGCGITSDQARARLHYKVDIPIGTLDRGFEGANPRGRSILPRNGTGTDFPAIVSPWLCR